MDPKIQSLDEYLGEHGFSSPISDFLIDKVKFPHGMTQGQRKVLEKGAAEAARKYSEQRKSAIDEYNRLLADGKIRSPSQTEHLLKVACGNEDNAATLAARRALERCWVDCRVGSARKDIHMSSERNADNKSMQWEKYNISYERNGVYQTLFVRAPSAEVAGNYFRLHKPDATICGVSKATRDDERPGKPELTAKLYEVWKDCELGQTYKEKSFLSKPEADEWMAENERCYPGWHLRVVAVEEKKLSLDERIRSAEHKKAETPRQPVEHDRDAARE